MSNRLNTGVPASPSGYSAEPEPSCTVSAANAVSIPNAVCSLVQVATVACWGLVWVSATKPALGLPLWVHYAGNLFLFVWIAAAILRAGRSK